MLYTLAGLATYQEDIKKSRFLVWAAPIQSAPEALRFFAGHSVPAATHNCWAYRIGNEYRFNDDGEPGGTAGRPILQAIEGQQCDRVAILVVRWFGGVKLGPGGLIRAYGGTAAQCLRLGAKVAVVDEVTVQCSCAFGDMAIVQSRLAALEARVVTEAFDPSGVAWEIVLPRSQLPDFIDQLTNLTRGQGKYRIEGDEQVV
ncbi:MAG TPA: YigZ family protein [Eoetvoesiella sp.]